MLTFLKLKLKLILILILISVFVAASISYAKFFHSEYKVSLDILLPNNPGNLEVFYDGGEGYVAGKSLSTPGAGIRKTYKFYFRKNSGNKNLRIDPAVIPGDINLYTIEFSSDVGNIRYDAKTLINKIRLLNQIKLTQQTDQSLVLKSEGNDPFFDIGVPDAVLKINYFSNILTFFSYLAATIFVSFFILFILPILYKTFKNNRVLSRLDMLLDKHINQKEIIIFDRLAIFFVIGLCVIGVILLFFKINFSSLPMYDEYFPSQEKSTILAGKALGIRSDEWMVQTPFLLNQLSNDNGKINLSVGAASAPLLTAIPVSGVINFVQPKYWGFIFFDVERGFSWLWIYKAVGFIFSCFLLGMILTQSNSALSICLALILYSTQFTQWWLSSNYAEIIIGFNGVIISFSYILFSNKKSHFIIFPIFALIFSCNFILHLYPAFLIPLIYLGVFIIVGLFFGFSRYEQFFGFVYLRLTAIVFSVFLIISFLYVFYNEALGTIQILSNTIYPGKRASTGGGELWKIFTGYFDVFFFDQTHFPKFLGNVCEASSFYMLFPLIPLCLILKKFRDSVDTLIFALSVYIVIIILWLTIGFSPSLAHYSMLELSPPPRALIGLGFASIFLSTVVFSILLKKNIKFSLLFAGTIVFIIFMVMMRYGYFLAIRDPVYYVPQRIVIASIILALFSFAFLRANLRLFTTLVIITAIPGFFINPWVVGMDSFYKKDIAYLVKEVDSKEKGRWAVFGSFVWPQYFKGLGLFVFNGTKFAPDFNDMKILDPNFKFIGTWNRYAHLNLIADYDSNEPIIRLDSTDVYSIIISPCSEQFKKLSINYVIVPAVPNARILDCGKKINAEPVNGLDVYKLF